MGPGTSGFARSKPRKAEGRDPYSADALRPGERVRGAAMGTSLGRAVIQIAALIRSAEELEFLQSLMKIDLTASSDRSLFRRHTHFNIALSLDGLRRRRC